MLVDHFSKILMPNPVKNNNTKNILLCLKQIVNYIGFLKIFQSENGAEYNNSIVKYYLITNNIKQIFSSPPHQQTNCVWKLYTKK